MTSHLNNIALIGSHTEGFQVELKEAGFAPVIFDSADNLLADLDSYSVVALSGKDHGLDDKNTISTLLDAGKILVAFEPGADYLRNLHAVTGTPVDLTALKPTSNRPLMIYKQDDDITLTLTPKVKTGFEVPNGKFQPVYSSSISPDSGFNTIGNESTVMDNALSQVVGQIKRAIDAVSQGSEEIKPFAAGEVYGLDPGWDVAFYKKIHLIVPCDYHIKLLAFSDDGADVTTNDNSRIQVYHTEWNMTIHVYATKENPVGRTAETYEGTVYTYIVHDGVHERMSGSPERSFRSSGLSGQAWEYYFTDILEYSVQPKDNDVVLSKLTQLPDDNQFEHRDNVFSYNISHEQPLTLFKKNKKQKWDFTANYQKPCAWNRFQLHRDTPSWNDAGYVLSYNDYYIVWEDPKFKENDWYNVFDTSNESQSVKKLPDDNLPFSGLTVFDSKVGKVPLHLEVDYIPRAFAVVLLGINMETSAADVIGLYVDDFVLDLTWDE